MNMHPQTEIDALNEIKGLIELTIKTLEREPHKVVVSTHDICLKAENEEQQKNIFYLDVYLTMEDYLESVNRQILRILTSGRVKQFILKTQQNLEE